MQRSVSKPIREVVKGISIVLALSVILVFVSHSITFSHLEESIFNQYATVRGEPFVSDGKRIVIEPFYNRILFPWVFVLFTKIMRGWTDAQIFLMLRFASFVICLSVIYVAASRRASLTNDVMFALCAIAAAIWVVPGLLRLLAKTESRELFMLGVVALGLGIAYRGCWAVRGGGGHRSGLSHEFARSASRDPLARRAAWLEPSSWPERNGRFFGAG